MNENPVLQRGQTWLFALLESSKLGRGPEIHPSSALLAPKTKQPLFLLPVKQRRKRSKIFSRKARSDFKSDSGSGSGLAHLAAVLRQARGLTSLSFSFPPLQSRVIESTHFPCLLRGFGEVTRGMLAQDQADHDFSRSRSCWQKKVVW